MFDLFFAPCPKWKKDGLQRSRLLTLGKNVLKTKPGIRKEKPEVTNTLSLKIRVKVWFLWMMEKRGSIC